MTTSHNRGEPNEVLARLLDELSWSPRMLGRRLNRMFGEGTAAETAPYHWRDRGRTPRLPLPTMVAHLLSCELGRLITVAQLWRGHAVDAPLLVPADAGLQGPWSRRGTLNAIDDWVVSGLLDRRTFLAISGVSLTTVPALYLAGTDAPSRQFTSTDHANAPLIDQIEQSIPHLQSLDDEGGGGAYLTYVGAQFRAVALLLRDPTTRGNTERRLLRALAEIGQLAGWMAVDAAEHGYAQRYFLTALRAAQESGYSEMAAHIVADMAFQSTSCERASDGVSLGEAATRIASRAPYGVRASVQTRLAYGYAIKGDMSSFEFAYQQARETLADRGTTTDPSWMYYLTTNHLDSQAGYGLVHAGILALESDRATGRAMIRRGSRLLRSGAHSRPISEPSQRRALFEGAWLATGAAALGQHEEACRLGRTALARTDTVRSPRSMAVLQKLADRLHRASRNEYVRDFLPLLDARLSLAQGQTRV